MSLSEMTRGYNNIVSQVKYQYEVIDPLKLEDEIEKLRKEIEDFELEVDSILTESNVMTQIEIPD